jgi:hypothetical protein
MAGSAAMGISISYNSQGLTATSFNVSDTVDNADGSHLGQSVGDRRQYVPTFVQREISVDYIANSIVTAQTGAITISGPNSLSFTGNATLTSSSLGGSVGDLIKGSITWRVA